MKYLARKSFLLSLPVVVSALIFSGNAPAQTLTPLYSFTTAGLIETPTATYTNGDGAVPRGKLLLSGSALYGTTLNGGSLGYGTIFKIGLDGSGFTTLYQFQSGTDGAFPQAGLIQSGNVFYGAASGIDTGSGTVFCLNMDGSGFKTLHTFGGLDGVNPYGGLVVAGNTLYGTTQWGGTNSLGNIYAVNTDGSGFTNLHNFTVGNGGYPADTLLLSGDTLYGTSETGGSDSGTVFSIKTDGTGFANLYRFSAANDPLYENNDGAYPMGGLVLSGNTLYGTAYRGGKAGCGTVFAVNTDGSGFTNLYQFTNGMDGAWPTVGLVLSGDTLYGTTTSGGSANSGTVFALHTDGTGFTNLASFGSNTNDVEDATANLTLVGNTLYGITSWGGDNGSGMIFKLDLPSDAHAPFFQGEAALGNNVYYLAFSDGVPFGYYSDAYFPWVYHFDLGFEYFFDANDGLGSTYFYDNSSGHFWYSSPQLFPYLYDFSLNAWLYYYPDPQRPGHYTTNPRSFYNFGTSQIIQE